MERGTRLSPGSIVALLYLGLFEGLVLMAGMGRGLVEDADTLRDVLLVASGAGAVTTFGVACTVRLTDPERLLLVVGGLVLSIAVGWAGLTV